MNKLYIFALGLLVLTACTTQKKRSDQSALSKAWHNTNAHYNGYFNAEENISESILTLSEQHEDNYLKLLDIYQYTEVDNPQAVAEQLDEAVKKVTVVVNLHPYSQWSDDCYFIAGKALYLKQDYEGAEKAFRFLINKYPPETKEDTKKERSNKNKKKPSRNSRAKSSGNSGSSASDAPKPTTQRERDRARKAYNKEVARKKKQRAKDRRRGKPSSSKSNTAKQAGTTEAATPKTTTTTTTPTTTEETKEPNDSRRTGMVRLSNNAETAIDNNTKNYRMKHRPIFQEGQLWLARTFIERDNYNAARRILNQLDQNTTTFKDVRRDVAVAQAHLAIKEKHYAEATTALNNAINKASERDDKARLAFILGQLQQQLGNSSAAYAAYEQVVKARPDYVMEFAARLNMAQNAYKAGGGLSAEALVNLEKLLKDDKNLPYHDQIYFAMARIALDQGNNEQGMIYMQKSLANSTSNRAQKAEAYYYLATLFYSKEQYLSAKLYYDSTLTLMQQADERFGKTERLRNNLVDIALNIETIVLQDSLLALSNLDDDERAELAKKIQIERNKNAKAGTGTQRRDKFGKGSLSQARPNTPALRTASEFWAYDERNLKRGAREFSRKWGNRALEDNWRRSNSLGSSIAGVESVAEIDVNLLTPEEIDKILEDIPQKDSEIRSSELEIKKAMFELGRLYRDRLENNEKCIEILEELDRRFPGNLHELDSWYYLYVAHTSLNNTAEAKKYRDKILQKYPSSNYGQILINPNYAQEQLNEELQMNKTYNGVYALFERGEYQTVLTEAEKNINRIIGQHPLKPRYALLMAMSTGSIQGKDAYILELQKLIATYTDTPEETRAKEILRLLGGAGASLPGGSEEVKGNFKLNDSELHYILVVFESDEIDLNANKIAVSDYNKSYHSLDRIRISNVYLGDKNNVPVLVLRRFKNKAKAMEYYNGLQKNSSDFIDPTNNPFKVMPISQSNYREVLRNRSVDGYETFFKMNY